MINFTPCFAGATVRPTRGNEDLRVPDGNPEKPGDPAETPLSTAAWVTAAIAGALIAFAYAALCVIPWLAAAK